MYSFSEYSFICYALYIYYDSACLISAYLYKNYIFSRLYRVIGIVMVFLFVHCPLPDRVFHKILFILPTDNCEL